MKPIIYMHLIVIVFSAICAYFLFYEKPPQQETYLRINEKAISREDYEKSLKTRPYYQNEAQFLEQFLEKELLIQEAMDKKLHQEEAFTQKVKTFYEKNLVQLLMEKKAPNLPPRPSRTICGHALRPASGKKSASQAARMSARLSPGPLSFFPTL